MDWSLCPDVESDPARMSGAWVVKGTRVPAEALVENAGEGLSAERLVSELYPTVPLESAKRILSFAQTHEKRSA